MAYLFEVNRGLDLRHILDDISLQRLNIDRLPHDACHCIFCLEMRAWCAARTDILTVVAVVDY